jgi:hypothetical protein
MQQLHANQSKDSDYSIVEDRRWIALDVAGYKLLGVVSVRRPLISERHKSMVPGDVPNFVLVISLVLYSVVGDFASRAVFPSPLSYDDLNRPQIFREYPNLFGLLALVPAPMALTIFLWTFWHASWWEPPLTLGFGLTIVAPVFVSLLRVLGDACCFFAFILCSLSSPLLTLWALKGDF